MPERTHRDVFLLSIFTFLVGCVVGIGGSRLYKPTREQVLEAQNIAAVALAATTTNVPPSSTTKAAEFRVQQQHSIRTFVHWLWVVSRNASNGDAIEKSTVSAREQFIAIGEDIQKYYGVNDASEKIPLLFAQYADAVIAYAVLPSSDSEQEANSRLSLEKAGNEMVTQLLKVQPGLSRDVLQNLLHEFIPGVRANDYALMSNMMGKWVDALVASTVRTFPEQF